MEQETEVRVFNYTQKERAIKVLESEKVFRDLGIEIL